MSRRRKPGENADRQRYLHHAAIAACRNREISIAQLNDVLAHRGWNPRLHPVVQEVALGNAGAGMGAVAGNLKGGLGTASAVDGATTFNPGDCRNHASGFCEWNGPPENPSPDGSRTVIGTASPCR